MFLCLAESFVYDTVNDDEAETDVIISFSLIRPQRRKELNLCVWINTDGRHSEQIIWTNLKAICIIVETQ